MKKVLTLIMIVSVGSAVAQEKRYVNVEPIELKKKIILQNTEVKTLSNRPAKQEESATQPAERNAVRKETEQVEPSTEGPKK